MVYRKVFFLIVLWLVSAHNYAVRFLSSALKIEIQAQYGLTDTQSTIPALVFAGTYLVSSPFFAILGDKGMPRLVAIGTAVVTWSTSTVMAATCQSMRCFGITQCVLAMSEAAFAAVVPLCVCEAFDNPVQQARVFGFMATAGPVGGACGFIIGGSIGHHFNWHLAYLFMGVIGYAVAPIVIGVAMCSALLPDTQEAFSCNHSQALVQLPMDDQRGIRPWNFNATSSESLVYDSCNAKDNSDIDVQTLSASPDSESLFVEPRVDRRVIVGSGGDGSNFDVDTIQDEMDQVGTSDKETGFWSCMCIPDLLVRAVFTLATHFVLLVVWISQTLIMFGMAAITEWIVTFMVRTYGQQEARVNLEWAGLVIGAVTAIAGITGSIVGALLSTLLINHYDVSESRAFLGVAGAGVVLASLFAGLSIWSETSSACVGFMAASQFFLWFHVSPISTTVAMHAPESIRGTIFSIMAVTNRLFGELLSPVLVAMLIEHTGNMRLSITCVPLAWCVSGCLMCAAAAVDIKTAKMRTDTTRRGYDASVDL